MNPHKDQEDELLKILDDYGTEIIAAIRRGYHQTSTPEDVGDLTLKALEEAMPKAEAWRDKAVNQALDNIEASVKQHTVPEGRDLVTRSYVMNTLEFERQRLVASKKVDR